jgi:hypothetical protein
VKDVHSKIPSPTVIHEDEASVTEKIESDGLYDAFGSDYCADSQSTEILPSNNSSAHGTSSVLFHLFHSLSCFVPLVHTLMNIFQL